MSKFKGTNQTFSVYGNSKTEIVTHEKGILIADCEQSQMISIEEKQANTKLFSASKDLFQSLSDIVNFLEVQKDIYSKNRTAKLAFEIKIKEAKNAIKLATE